MYVFIVNLMYNKKKKINIYHIYSFFFSSYKYAYKEIYSKNPNGFGRDFHIV